MATKPIQMIQSVERVYAQALLELAGEQGQEATVAENLQEIGRLLEAEPELLQLMACRAISAAHRAQSLQRMFAGQIGDLLLHFLLIVNEKDRLGELPGIIHAYAELWELRQGRVDIDATIAQAMDAPQVQTLTARISAALNRQAVVYTHVDSTLIGGLKLLVGDRLIDGSVATQLRLLKEKMIAAGREQARQAATE